jgi:molecular chaperone HtpG
MKAAGQNLPPSKPIFELNPEHLLIQKLRDQQDDDKFKELTFVLFDQAILAESGQLTNASEFVGRLNNLLLENMT